MVLGLSASFAAVPAWAQSATTAAGTGSATVTYTDNLYNAPANPAPDGPTKQSSLYLALTPGVALSHERARSGYALTYAHSFFRYLTAAEADSHGDELAAAADYRLTPVDDISFRVLGSRSSTATLLMDPTAQGRPQPDTAATFYTGSATQSWSHAFSAEWAATQAASFGIATVTDSQLPEPWRQTTSGSVGAIYSLPSDTYTFEWTGSYFRSSAAERGDLRVPKVRYFETGPEVGWAHVIDEQWATKLGGGIGSRYSPSEDPRLSIAPPTFSAGLEWQLAPYAAALSYSASTDVNLFTNRVYYTDAASLSASWSILPRQAVDVSTKHTVSANRPLISPEAVGASSEEATTYAWTSTAGLTWAPPGLPRFSLTYAHAAQVTTGDSNLGTTSPDFHRNQIAFSVGWEYPRIQLDRLARRSTFRPSATQGELRDGDLGDSAPAARAAENSGMD